jgi:hypothetical protein
MNLKIEEDYHVCGGVWGGHKPSSLLKLEDSGWPIASGSHLSTFSKRRKKFGSAVEFFCKAYTPYNSLQIPYNSLQIPYNSLQIPYNSLQLLTISLQFPYKLLTSPYNAYIHHPTLLRNLQLYCYAKNIGVHRAFIVFSLWIDRRWLWNQL